MSGKKVCFQFPECSLSYAKITQTSGKKFCFQFPKCNLSGAKIIKKGLWYRFFMIFSSSLCFILTDAVSYTCCW